ncbi:MAG: metallophosphoesterase [Candidatus Moraniibacteriota bacterium]
MSTYVIGDIHGEIKQLKKILSKINYDSSADRLIFLGDYIDRGEDPYQVYNLIQNLNCDENVFLKGNHEDMMTKAVLKKEQINLWYYNGGQITKNSFPHHRLNPRKYLT